MELTVVVVLGGLLLAFFFMGNYVAVALGFIAYILMFLFSDRPIFEMTGLVAWKVNYDVVLVAIPLFILMGQLLMRSGMTERLYRSLSNWLNPLPGGLLHSNIAASAVFASVSGSSLATAATIGTIALPSFKTRKYNESLVLGSIAGGGTLGILIPPSVTMIVYGVLAEESIGRLYLGGIVPGILMTITFLVMLAIVSTVQPKFAPREQAAPWKERFAGLVSMFPVIFLILLVLGTIYAGIATPTEAAAFGVVGAIVVCILFKRLNLKVLEEAFLETAVSTSMIMFILTAAFMLNYSLSILGIPLALARFLVGMKMSTMQIIIVICVTFLFLGTFMDSFAILVTTMPLLVPPLRALDINMVWFGIIVVMLTEAALVSPPYGLNLYVLHGVRIRIEGSEQKTMTELYIGILPFILCMVITIALVVAFPQIALWLPGTMRG